MEPRLERFVTTHVGELTGYRIDVDTDTVAEYGVMSIPTVLLLRDGNEIARLDGLIRDHDLQDAVRASRTAGEPPPPIMTRRQCPPASNLLSLDLRPDLNVDDGDLINHRRR